MNLWRDNYCLENDKDRKLWISINLFHYIWHNQISLYLSTISCPHHSSSSSCTAYQKKPVTTRSIDAQKIGM